MFDTEFIAAMYRKASRVVRKASAAAPTVTQVAKEMAKLAMGKNIAAGQSKYASGYAGKRIGRALGGKAGAKVGRFVGRRVGSTFARITGVGDYQIQQDGSLMSPETAFAPQMSSTSRDIVIERSEYIGDLYSGPNNTSGASDFNVQTFSVNPGLAVAEGGAFSWLPQVAAGFQQWQLRACVLEYRPTSGSATGSNTTLGSVMMAGDYNPANPTAFANKSDMMNSQWAISGAPDKCILFPVECAPRDEPIKWHDIRTGPLQSGENANLTDLCNLVVATQGMQTENQNLGELHIVYKVALTKYRMNALANTIPTAHYGMTGTAVYDNTNILGAGTTAANTPQPYPDNNLPLQFTDGNCIIFPASVRNTNNVYLVKATWKGTSTANCTITTGAVQGLEYCHTIFEQGRSPLAQFLTGSAATTVFNLVMFVKMNGSSTDGIGGNFPGCPYISLGVATLPASGTDFDLIVTQVNTPACPDLS